MKQQLSRTESNALRGIAILGIVLHNYTHWLRGMVKENEYNFVERRVDRLMYILQEPSWEWISQLLSFFGHYGVPIFLFLSAYGLVMKYERGSLPAASIPGSSVQESGFSFMKNHYKKLWKMMIIGYIAYVMVDFMTPHPRFYQFWNVVGQIGMFSNLYSNPDADIWPGPYWYFGLMVEVYALYRFVLYPGKGSLCGILSKKNANILLGGIAVASLIPLFLLDPEGLSMQWYKYNVFGSIAPFAAGLAYARSGYAMEWSRQKYGIACIAAFLFVFFGSLSLATWTIIPIAVCVGAVSFVKILPELCVNKLAWIGTISAAIFVSHPIARKIIIPLSAHGELYAGLILYTCAAIILGIIFKILIEKINS